MKALKALFKDGSVVFVVELIKESLRRFCFIIQLWVSDTGDEPSAHRMTFH